jgi:hypothetical protein
MAFRGIQSTNLISNDVGFNDPLLILNKESSLPTDVGWLGKIGPISYAGFVRDHETNTFLLIDSVDLTPNSLNSINAGEVTKGDLSVKTLTADTVIAGNIPSAYTDTQARAAISVSGDLSYDSSTGVISYTDVIGGNSNNVVYDLADPTGSVVLNPGTQPHVATYYGDVINSAGNVILDISSTTTTFTGGLAGDVYGDVYNPTGANKILESGTGNLDSALTVDSATTTTLNAGTTNISGIATFTGGSADFTGTTAFGNWNGAVYDRTGNTLIIDDTAIPKPIVYANIQGGVVGDVLGNLVGNVDGNVTGNLEGGIVNSQGQVVIDNSGSLSPDVFRLPKGLTADRPSPATAGMMFFNEGTNMFEGYDGTNWIQFIPSTFVETP